MPIGGIDGKIMLHKATDFSKEAAAQVKRAELMQEHAARQADKTRAQQRKKVNDVQNGQISAVRKDKNGEEKGRSTKEKCGSGPQQDEEIDISEDLSVERDGNSVDIRI